MPALILWVQISLLVLLIGVVGWLFYPYIFQSGPEGDAEPTPRIKKHLIIFLSGMGFLSLLFSVLATMKWFQPKNIMGAIACLLGGFVILFLRGRARPPVKAVHYLIFCLLLGSSVFGYSRLIRPFEAILYGNDASVYIAAGLQLAKGGDQFHEDPLLLEMTNKEKEIFDFEGGNVRHPGSVHFIERKEGMIGFVFFPLFPAWLAAGIYALGIHHFLYVLSLFAVLSLILVYSLGRELGGVPSGVAAVALLFVFYPQLYFSNIPFSEVAAQMLFLGGLWAIVTGLKNGPVPSEGLQKFAGILWGSVFLCRIDLMFFILLSILVMFSAIPSLSANVRKWKPFLFSIAILFLFTFYRQLATGLYLQLWGLKGNVLVRNLWMPVIPFLHFQAKAHPFIAGVIFLILSALLALGFRFWSARPGSPLRTRARRISGVLVGMGVVLLMIGTHFDPEKLLLQLNRISLYTEVWVLCMLIAGIGLYILFLLRNKDSAAGWVCLILFFLPTLFYLNRPLNVLEQPFFIRRFVPVTFPILFLLSICGWQDCLVRIVKKPYVAKAILCLFLIFSGFALYQKSSFLLKVPLYQGIIDQAFALRTHIPQNALVLLPSVDEGKHMSMCMQYLLERDVVSFPIQGQYNPAINDFLVKMIDEGRPVILMVVGSLDYVTPLLEHFDISDAFAQRISFHVVSPVDVDEFPAHSFLASLDYKAYRLRKKGAPAFKSELRFDDREVTFLAFHSREQKFRWTNGEGEITNFYFDTEGQDTVLSLHLEFFPDGYSYGDLEILVNGKIRAVFEKRDGNEFIFHIPGGDVGRISSVRIVSRTFIPSKAGISPDPRILGVPFIRLRFIRSGDL